MSIWIPRRGAMQGGVVLPPGFWGAVLADSPLYACTAPDGAATFIDQSPNGRNGTVNGPTAVAASVLTGSDGLNCDGVDDYVSWAHQAVFDVGDVFTIETIFKRNRSSVAAGEVLFHKGNNAPTLWFPGSGANNNRLTLRKAAVANVMEANADLTDTAGYHYAAVAKNGATYRLVIDGVSVGVDLGNQTMANTANEIRAGFSTGATQAFGGVIVMEAFYATELSLARLQAHHAAIA